MRTLMPAACAALTLAVPAQAGGLFKTLTPEQHHLKYCEAAAELEWEQDRAGAAIQVWHDCIQEASHRGYAELGPILRGHLIHAQTRRDYGRYDSSDPLLYSRIVLATVAQNPDATFPFELIDAHWHRLLVDNESRQNLASVRTVTVRWLNKSQLDPTLYESFEQNVRRFVGDMGFKVPLPHTAEAGETAIIVMLEGSLFTEEVVEGPLTFHQFEVQFESMPVKFKQRSSRGAPVRVSYIARGNRPEEARTEAIESAAKAFAHGFQARVVTEVFRNYDIPAP